MRPVSFDFEAMRSVDVRTVNAATLVNIHDIDIKRDLPFIERAYDYLKQIGNPYCFLCGDVVVKIRHSQTNTTISDCMEVYMRTLD